MRRKVNHLCPNVPHVPKPRNFQGVVDQADYHVSLFTIDATQVCSVFAPFKFKGAVDKDYLEDNFHSSAIYK